MNHRLCAAPMMDWTDRHCRYFLRQCAPHARLYTEMITTGALLHGDAARHLAFDPAEHPVAVQLGGSEPDELAACVAPTRSSRFLACRAESRPASIRQGYREPYCLDG